MSLNLKNGANTFLTALSLNSNPNLSCIQVDDPVYMNANWSLPYYKDTTATYSEDCSALSINEIVFEKMVIYPNPVKEELHIDNVF